ncbi:MAG: 16S rRNA (cytosine(1402)-N(4))-methyltransferase RsmH [Elusimicrobia bacterium]|nr:16S rRNA (cytosine(1402)-N(4))-methyltransferase RsmH [Elusimicrobiota bacterium]
MPGEIIDLLDPKKGGIVIDGTVGEGGHSEVIGERLGQEGLLIGIDRDKEVLDAARKRLSEKKIRFKLFHGSYGDSEKIIDSIGIDHVDGILLDLGFSRRHIEVSGKGFSFLKNEPLDMRYDTGQGFTAGMWINSAPALEIEKVLREYGGEKEYRKIVREVVKRREEKEIKTSAELAEIVRRAKRAGSGRIHPATKTFQAVRIHVNRELEEVARGVRNCLKIIKRNGKLAVLTYHSLEDRIIKNIFLEHSGKCMCPPGLPECRCEAGRIRPRVRVLKAIRPAAEEVSSNPPSRSAHLRGCEITDTI